MGDYFLEARGIYKSFGGVHALKNVDLYVKPGESLCLVGENGCGKSTLIKIISGAYEMDKGELTIRGKVYKKMTPMLSSKEGIQVIYQDFSLFHNLTVAENIAMLYNLGEKGPFSKKKNITIAKQILEEIGVEIDPNTIVDKLSIAQRQIVAICRALVRDAQLIIMDEPTTALTSKEVDALYVIIEKLKAKGIALIFVSHKLEEVFRIAERIVVIRNGENVVEGPAGDFTMESLTYHMTGKEQTPIPFDNKIDTGEVILSCRNMAAKDDAFRNISFDLHRGEVLGITGLLGSGREALAEALFGIYPHTADKLELCGKPLKLKDSKTAVREGIGYVPEDRAVKGLYMDGSIGSNIASAILFRYNKLGFMRNEKLRNIAKNNVEDLRIVCAGIDAPASSLSGANQQRIVIAKWRALEPKLIILNCPTVGVDVGSKADIHALAREFADSGVGVILISDDLSEIKNACNRVLVINHGEISECFHTADVSTEDLYKKLMQA